MGDFNFFIAELFYSKRAHILFSSIHNYSDLGYEFEPNILDKHLHQVIQDSSDLKMIRDGPL
jgi:hypothetical protein